MKMFKVMKTSSYKDLKGNVRPVVIYMKANTIEEVEEHLGAVNIWLAEEV